MTERHRTRRTHSWARRQIGSVRKAGFRLRYGSAAFVVSYFAARFRVRLADGVGKGIAANTYDHRQLSRLIAWARRERPTLFLDIGANLGLYSCVLVGAGHVPRAIAFEPDRDNRAALADSIALNGLAERIRIEACALGAATGEAVLVEGPRSNRGTSRLVGGVADDAASGAERYRVPVRRLDDVVAIRGAVLLVKIDVEGHERDVIEGATRTLSENRCLLQVEAFGTGPVGALEALGYTHVGSIADDHYWVGGSAGGTHPPA